MNTRKITSVKIIAVLLVLSFILPINVTAAEPRASYYLDAYTAYIYQAGWGKIQVWFDVEGTNDMDEIGALEIKIYESTDNENWNWVETFRFTDHPDMLAYHDYSHTGHVEYSGTLGRYYKAYVCVWAGKDSDGDTRYFWTSAKKATLFAA